MIAPFWQGAPYHEKGRLYGPFFFAWRRFGVDLA